MTGASTTGALAARELDVRLGRRDVLHGISVTIARGEMVGLIGPNGAGKTTLLRCLAGLLAPVAGSVLLDGEPLGRIEARRRAQRIGFLPQDAQLHWRVPVRDVVAAGRLPHRGPFARAGAEDAARVNAALAAVGAAELAGRPATELSGGERARVLLARALAGTPDYLLADEPVAGLDPYHRLEVMDHFAKLAEDGTAIIVVLHDLTLAARYCSRLVLLDAGGVVADDAPDNVLSDARLAAVYRIRADRSGGHIVPAERVITSSSDPSP